MLSEKFDTGCSLQRSEGNNMGNVKIGNMEISIGDLLLMIGGLVMLIAVFLSWTTYSAAVLAGWKDVGISGMDLISGKLDGTSVSYSFLGKAPLFVLIFGIAAIVLGALPLFKIDNKGIKIAGAVVALLALIFAIMYMIVGGGASLFSGDDKTVVENGIKLGFVKMKLAFGSIMALIAAIVATAGGVMNILPIFKK